MDNLIGRLVANADVDRMVAEKAVGITLQFLLKGEDAVDEIVGAIPGLG
jgi:hypothetical protein